MDQAKRSVAALQQTLQETPVAEPQQAAAADLAAHCERFQDDPQTHHQTLHERLEAALVEFGADHQSVSEALRLAIYDLSNAGV